MSSKYFSSQTVVFILDAVDSIFIYIGMNVKKSDKRMAVELANKIKAELRGGRAEIIHIYEDPSNEKFWSHFRDVSPQLNSNPFICIGQDGPANALP